MAKKKYDEIYQDLRSKLENGTYKAPDLIPSENILKETYQCSRNTVRSAIAQLAEEGYLMPIHGKGVRIIYDPSDRAEFIVGGIESFVEASVRNRMVPHTKVVTFSQQIIDKQQSEHYKFPVGSEVFYIERIRYLNKQPLIFDINIFLKSEVGNLTKEIAQDSIYRYLEEDLGMLITTSKRRITSEKATKADTDYLNLKDFGFDFVSVITGQVFNSNGVMFEYTQSRHRPDYFCFYDTAVRSRK